MRGRKCISKEIQDKIIAYKVSGLSEKEIVKELGVSTRTIWKYSTAKKGMKEVILEGRNEQKKRLADTTLVYAQKLTELHRDYTATTKPKSWSDGTSAIGTMIDKSLLLAGESQQGGGGIQIANIVLGYRSTPEFLHSISEEKKTISENLDLKSGEPKRVDIATSATSKEKKE